MADQVELQDSDVKHLRQSIQTVRRSLTRRVVSAEHPLSVLEEAAEALFKSLPLEGTAVRLTRPAQVEPQLLAAFGSGSRLAGAGEAPGSQRLQVATADRGAHDFEPCVMNCTFQVSGAGRVEFLVSYPRAADGQFPRGWLDGLLAPILQLLEQRMIAREAEALACSLVRYGEVPLAGLDDQGHCTLWNPAAESQFGWPEVEVLHRPLALIRPVDREVWRETVDAVVQSGRIREMPLSVRCWDGRSVETAVRLIPVRRENLQAPNLLVTFQDQTGLRESQAWARITAGLMNASTGDQAVVNCLAILKSLGGFRLAALWRRDEEGGGWSREDSTEKREGLPPSLREVLDRSVDVHLLEIVGPVAMRAGKGSGFASVPDQVDLFGIPLPDRRGVLVLGQPEGAPLTEVARGALRQVTEILVAARRHDQLARTAAELQERTARAEKLEALGLLTTGVAHDLNNILTIVFGYAELARSAKAPDECLNEIEKVAGKAAQLTRQLLRSGRASRNEMAIFDLATAIDELSPLIRSLTGAQVEFRLDATGGQSLSVRMQRSEFDQILLNLVSNARDAMPAGGTITCRLQSCEPTLNDLKQNPCLRSGAYAGLSIIDEGAGLTPEARAHMFDPFFTTKEADSGTGVGLATVRQIVDRAAGGIRVESRPGAGTSMTILLPRVLSEICPRQVFEAPEETPGGSESVLVLDEDPRVRELLTRLLRLRGYEAQAIADWSSSAGNALSEADLIVLDGDQLQRLTEVSGLTRSRARCVLTLVDGVTEQIQPPQAGWVVRSLAKPFTSHQLAVAVRQTLDAGGGRHRNSGA